MRFSILYLVAACLLCGCATEPQIRPMMHTPMNLAGQWEFALDPQEVGEQQQWFNRLLDHRINLPGSTVEQGFGDNVSVDTQWTGDILDRTWFTDARYEKYRQPGNVKVPFWLTPLKSYVGPAWYRRTFNIPSNWTEDRAILFLERPHWTTKVWIDGKPLGMQDSLGTPHEYDLGNLGPGQHVLTIRVDNRLHVEVGANAHSVSDHTQTNWNGIVGRIELQRHEPVSIEDVQIYPDVSLKTARVKVSIRNTSGKTYDGNLILRSTGEVVTKPVQIAGQTALITAVYPLGKEAQLWDEFSPTVHTMQVQLGDEVREVKFGLRDFSTQGTQFAINGRLTFLRGTLECAIFPETGYPPTDVTAWKRIMTIVKAHGLNHIRFHSWCPPEAAFTAADESGIYLQIEAGTWPNAQVVMGPGSPAGLGDGKAVDTWLKEESQRILRTYGNHPSFVMMAAGNEPGGPKHGEYLTQWVNQMRATDSRRIYTGTAGWPELLVNQFQVVSDPRIQHWGEGLKSRINANPPETVTDYRDFIAARSMPVVSHEIGQWCVFPNLAEIDKYKGIRRAYNFEIVRDALAGKGMLDQARDFTIASGKLQALCYKEEIESALRTKGMGGFQLLDLHDFPGQGTALVGVLDPFWDYKGYITADEYHRFASQTVPLVRMARRVWTTDETFQADVEIAHFGPRPLTGAVATWRLTTEDGSVFAQDDLPATTIPIGNGTSLGRIRVPLTVHAPQKLVLTVALRGTSFSNSWDIWVYPQRTPTTLPADVIMSDSLDDKTIAALNEGGKVLLLPRANSAKGDSRGKVEIGFSPIFWNTSWTTRQAPHTLGILCDPNHPALRQFPTDFHTNWQWWDLLSKSQAMILDGLGPDCRPVVQVIDDWVTNRKLGLVIEVKVGNGRLLVCSMDLKTDLENRPVARQMLASLLAYMQSPGFAPTQTIEIQNLRDLFVTGP